MLSPLEKILVTGWNIGNKAAWVGLRLTRMDGVMSNVLSSVSPAHYEALWADAQERAVQERERQLVRDLGRVTTHAFRGDILIDYRDLDPAWQALKQGETSVVFEDVHDPHTALLLHSITPAKMERTGTVELKPL